MKKFFSILLALIVPSVAFADQAAIEKLMALGMPGGLAEQVDANFAQSGGTSGGLSTTGSVIFRNATGTPQAWITPASGTLILNGTTGTAGLSFTGSTGGVVHVPSVPTTAATPAAPANVAAKFAFVPTAAANNAVLLPSSMNAGDTYVISNIGPNSIRIKAGGTNTINGGTAGAYFPLTTKLTAVCFNDTATNSQCGTLTVPTQAGP